ncbi:MAG TPA: hypothetical protein VGR76_01280 [Candidatus Angelobacter sp.]|jgi:hypothetical protein|nr:hypothetical protein [Candidatus Angelobacter sp.]
MKKQLLFPLAVLLLIPIVLVMGVFLFSLINPEIAAGHANYVRNYRLLNLVKITTLWATGAVVVIVWLLSCFLVIRSKERSTWWLLLAALGPFGFAALMLLNDKNSRESDRYVRFVRGMNGLVRVGYEAGSFVTIWWVAYGAMVLKRYLMILCQSALTGMPVAQIIDIQNASSGMWAFGEGTEVMFLVVVLYLIRPVAFNFVGHLRAANASRSTQSA